MSKCRGVVAPLNFDCDRKARVTAELRLATEATCRLANFGRDQRQHHTTSLTQRAPAALAAQHEQPTTSSNIEPLLRDTRTKYHTPNMQMLLNDQARPRQQVEEERPPEQEETSIISPAVTEEKESIL